MGQVEMEMGKNLVEVEAEGEMVVWIEGCDSLVYENVEWLQYNT